MSKRWIAVAGLLVVVLSFAFADGPTPPRGKMCTKTFCVADLVVPIPSSSNQESKTEEEKLIKRIMINIAPKSWWEMGGAGTIAYFPLTMSLVVNQTVDVQEKIEALLATLRREQETPVMVELRLVRVRSEMLDKLTSMGKEVKSEGYRSLNKVELVQFLETAQTDKNTSVMLAPRLTMFHGQNGNFAVGQEQVCALGIDFETKDAEGLPKTKMKPYFVGTKGDLLPTFPPDKSMVTLKVGITNTSMGGQSSEQPSDKPCYNVRTLEAIVKLAPESTAVLRGWSECCEVRTESTVPVLNRIPYVNRAFKNVSCCKETEHTLILVTPHFVTEKQETQSLPMPKAVAACPVQCPHPVVGNEVCEAPAHPPTPPMIYEERPQQDTSVMYINKRSFDLTYRLENVGPSKVRSIEVWWTRGDGSWSRYPDEVKPAGPIPITVQHDGRYGFSLVATSGAGLCGKRPMKGDQPDVWVEVDTKAPVIEVYAPDVQGMNPEKETIIFSWKADDKHIATNPVVLHWSENNTGPWHLIATDLPAQGKHECSCKGLPYQFYIRATATDRAGNVAEATTPQPIKIDLRVPVIRDVKVRVSVPR
jgi:hypothetical protein